MEESRKTVWLCKQKFGGYQAAPGREKYCWRLNGRNAETGGRITRRHPLWPALLADSSVNTRPASLILLVTQRDHFSRATGLGKVLFEVLLCLRWLPWQRGKRRIGVCRTDPIWLCWRAQEPESPAAGPWGLIAGETWRFLCFLGDFCSVSSKNRPGPVNGVHERSEEEQNLC